MGCTEVQLIPMMLQTYRQWHLKSQTAPDLPLTQAVSSLLLLGHKLHNF